MEMNIFGRKVCNENINVDILYGEGRECCVAEQLEQPDAIRLVKELMKRIEDKEPYLEVINTDKSTLFINKDKIVRIMVY